MTAISSAGIARAGSLRKYQISIGGTWRDPHSAAWLESFDPSTGESVGADSAMRCRRCRRSRGGRTHRFHQWGVAAPEGHGARRLLRRLGDLCAENVAALSAIEVRDCGKRTAESLPQLQYLAEYFYYSGGLADKIEGAVIPLDRPGDVQLHALGAVRRRRRDHAVELAADAGGVEAGARLWPRATPWC